MASIWRAIRPGRFKHEKLSEETAAAIAEAVDDGSPTRFSGLQYLECIPVEKPSGVNETAINRIMALSRRTRRRNRLAELMISGTAVTMTVTDSTATEPSEQEQIEIPLNRISYCFVDSNHDRVLAFVATNSNGCHECHGFLAPTPKLAKLIAVAVSGAFVQAYERWLQRQKTPVCEKPIISSNQPLIMIDLENNDSDQTASQQKKIESIDEWLDSPPVSGNQPQQSSL